MDSYIVPVTFPDLDMATREAGALVDALRASGLHAEMVAEALGTQGNADRPDPGPTTRELHVRATGSADDVRQRVQEVADGRFPRGILLLGDPLKV
ncbi:hypothetical protein [Antribacter gilvus]|uniref:hypothetical protein n=1 Tax=Antribacter gilvus TaxID=2304675 RepID=UPI000F7A341B|nr:hypothetical protein [Antribacter gilvus]